MNRRSLIKAFAVLFASKAKPVFGAGLAPIDESGFRHMIAEHRGKILLVDFWATWCSPCREEFPKLVALHVTHRQRGFDLVTISCDEPEQEAQAAQFAAKQGAPTPYYVRRARNDDTFINAIDAKWSGALPALFVFGRDGRQLRSFIGETDMKDLEAYLEKVLGS